MNVTSETLRIADVLGLHGAVRDRLSMARNVAEGLPAESARHVHDRIGASRFYRILPEATYRRVRRLDKPLTRETSEKLYEFARVYELALRLYGGDHDRTMRFLETPHPLLGGQAALDVAVSSSAGADAVSELLHQAEAGFAA
ncbi:antitoxin Xre/MbcA/ParS toxin-binding domain-containing protein [Paracoccus ravus]|uniref:antitoxin Xre/MbcA/ParS toxin-binding domain-containing protein n=1 Tax=Paracoccus ravus TaxID=2447760 RepID=UPI00106DEF10|nr:antitoxin Xre/MbcA/ParS toxin-binding domain-containing protein [Paracoccus ravus]